jgi:Zn-dependent protease with chaperone function
MQEDLDLRKSLPLDLLPYHAAVRDFLKQSEMDLWRWFASQRLLPKAWDEVRFDLLKAAYRIEREDQPELYAAADDVASKLGTTAPTTIYQSQNPLSTNASLAYTPGEIHVVLHGPIATQLTPIELRAILAHELAHYLLWDSWQGEMQIAWDVLQALVTDSQSHPAHFATLRLFQLYTEVFCDRVALSVTGDLAAVVSALVKVETGVEKINPQAFLRQADEIFAREDAETDGVTHPETYIRARALRLWSERDLQRDELIARMIEGNPSIDALDLLQQQRLAHATRRLLESLFAYRWICTDPLLAHAKLFFDDFLPAGPVALVSELAPQLRHAHSSVRDYFAFVLLDFVAAERELGEPLIAAVLTIADTLQMKERLLELLRQELKLRKTQLDKIDDRKASILAEVERTLVTT